MSSEYCIPKNNEDEFVEVASKLGIRKMCFLYDFDSYNEAKIKEKINSINNTDVKITTGLLVNQKNIKSASKFSNIIAAISSENDRFFIENKKVKIIFGFESLQKKDYIHQRGSGLNHILCETAKSNNVAIGFSYGLLLDGHKNPLLLGRMIQNILLCQKYKVKTVIASFSDKPYNIRSRHDVLSLFKLLGMSKKIESF